MKKSTRFFSLLLCLIMLFGVVPMTAMAEDKTQENVSISFAGGEGTVNNPYLITNAEQLDAIRYNLDAHYKQTNNIDMKDFGNWSPIGSTSSLSGSTLTHELPSVEEKPFKGSFDGNGYSIFNLSISNSSDDFADQSYGLFAKVDGGLVKNVELKNIDFYIDKSAVDYVTLWNEYGASYSVIVGGIAGVANTKIENCSVSGKIEIIHCNDATVGGIIGNGTASKCRSSTSINLLADKDSRYKNDSTIHCGGIVGLTSGVNEVVSECVNRGNIVATAGNYAYVGGISGEYGKIENCVNFGNVDGKTTAYNSYSSFAGNCNVGGIVGATSSDFTRYCVNYGL